MSTPDKTEEVRTVQWWAHYEMRGNVDDDQAAELLAGPAFSLRRSDNLAGEQWCRLTISVQAQDHTDAIRKAQRAYAQCLATVAAVGAVLEEPYRVTVEQADAPAGQDLLSTAAVAARLGVSDARVRQLAARPGFPSSVQIPGLTGHVYRASAIDAWAKAWDRDAKGGRPPSGER